MAFLFLFLLSSALCLLNSASHFALVSWSNARLSIVPQSLFAREPEIDREVLAGARVDLVELGFGGLGAGGLTVGGLNCHSDISSSNSS